MRHDRDSRSGGPVASTRWAVVACVCMVGSMSCGGGSPAAPAAPSPPAAAASPLVVLDAATFDVRVLANPRPSLVEFFSPTCPACQAMTPTVERLARSFEGRALVGTVDVTQEPALSAAYRVSAVPTFAFFVGGVEVSRQVGTTSYADLATRLQALISG